MGHKINLSDRVCVCVWGCSSASLPEPWAAGLDTAGRKDLQTMFMTVGLLLGLAEKDRQQTLTHTHTPTHTHTLTGRPECTD